MTLLDDWKTIARKAWSVRLTLLAALSAVIGALMPYVEQGGQAFVALSAILAVLAALSRLVVQPALHAENELSQTVVKRIKK